MADTERADDLFTPTLADYRPRPADAPRPWRLGSQFYTAFFGGPIAAAAVGCLNGRRLGLGRGRLLAIAAVGLVGFAAAVAVVATVDAGGSAPRFVVQAAGALCYVATRVLQKVADRRYRVQTLSPDDDEAYAGLLGPGLAIVVASWLVTALVIVPAEA